MIATGAVKAADITAPENWHVVGAPGEVAFNTDNGMAAPAADANPPYVCSVQSPGCPTYAPVSFYKDQLGLVHLRGSFTLGGSTILFQLPTGYQISQTEAQAFPVLASDGVPTRLVIYGPYVQVLRSSYTPGLVFSIDNVSFRPDS
jgi:hypothetical protein